MTRRGGGIRRAEPGDAVALTWLTLTPKAAGL
jgi:hypothetical protein